MLPWQTPVSDTERKNIVEVVHGWSQRHMVSFHSAWTAILFWSLRSCGAEPLHLKSLKRFIGNKQSSFVCRGTPSYWEGLVLLLLWYSSSDEDVNTSASYRCVCTHIYENTWITLLKFLNFAGNHPGELILCSEQDLDCLVANTLLAIVVSWIVPNEVRELGSRFLWSVCRGGLSCSCMMLKLGACRGLRRGCQQIQEEVFP